MPALAFLAAARNRLVSGVRTHLADGDAGKAAIAMALALLTVVAAIVAGLQGQASIEAARGKRTAERLAIEAAGYDSTSVVQIAAAYGTYRRWSEQYQRSSWARATSIAEDFGPSAKLYDTLDEAEEAIELWTVTQSEVLAPPYFDPEQQVSDFALFEGDRLVGPSTRLAEERDLEAAEAAAWDAKANEYVTILTIVAVGLFFLGLAATVGGKVRPFLAAAGLAFGFVSAGWAVVLATEPVHVVPPEAVEHVVASRVAVAGLFVDRGPVPVSDEVRSGLESAIAEADAAVSSDPGYLSAVSARADARLTLADALVFSADGPSEQTEELLDAALADLRLLATHQPDDAGVWWELGWAALLRGDLETSIAASSESIALQPEEFAVILNRAAARLLSGDAVGATADVDRTVELLGGQQGASAASYLAGTEFEFGRFAELWPAYADGMLALRDRLREVQVRLRIAGHPRSPDAAPDLPPTEIRPIEIGRYAYGRISERPPLAEGDEVAATDGVGLRIKMPAEPAVSGSMLSAHVWINGNLQPELASDVVLDGRPVEVDLVSPYGLAGFDLDPGAWEVELYLDGARRQRLAFTVAPPVDRPQFDVAASDAISTLVEAEFTCAEDAETEDLDTVCSGYFGEEGSYLAATVTSDEQDRITYLYLETSVYDDTEVEPVARSFFGYVADLVFPDDLAVRAAEWINEQGTEVNELELGGSTWRVFGAEVDRRFLDVWAPWPAG